LSIAYEYFSIVIMHKPSHAIEEIFGSPGRIAILRVLVTAPGPLTGRQVAELAGLTQAGTARALDRLGALGLTSRRRVGRAVTHALERENIVVRTIVLPAFEGESGLGTVLCEELAAVLGPLGLSVVLFGSVAGRQADPGSDVDVLLVVPDPAGGTRADAVVADWQPTFERRFAMPVSVLIKTPSELAAARSTPLVRAILRDGELLAGSPLDDVIGTGG
jgi:predicted nucleotidyltransferase